MGTLRMPSWPHGLRVERADREPGKLWRKAFTEDSSQFKCKLIPGLGPLCYAYRCKPGSQWILLTKGKFQGPAQWHSQLVSSPSVAPGSHVGTCASSSCSISSPAPCFGLRKQKMVQSLAATWETWRRPWHLGLDRHDSGHRYCLGNDQ